MNEIGVGILALFVLLLVFFTGIELGFAMALVGFAGFACIHNFGAAMNLLGRDIFDTFSSYSLTVVPLFILMGQIGFNAGLAEKLYNSAHKFIGHIPGGLAMATVLGATAFKTICGSSAATAATFASVAIPEMDRYGYSSKLSTGVVASVGTLGAIIPPSVVLIILGILTEQSIGKLFLAGLIPGLIIALFFMVVIYGWAKINPAVAPPSDRSTWKARWVSLPPVVSVLAIFFVVVGGILKGIFTPSEAGAVGTFTVLALTFLKRDMSIKRYVASVRESVLTAVMIMMLLSGSAVLGHFITATSIPQVASDWIVGLPLNKYIIVLMICLLYLIGGSFIDDIAFMILATPIFFPAVINLGFDPLWFGILVVVTVMMGVIVPPVAICVFIVKNITRVPIGIIYKGTAPFLISLILAGFVMFAFPQVVTWLPSVFFK